jgi:hypothetical protein
MNGVSANNRPLSDNVNGPVMGPVNGPVNKQFSSSLAEPSISSTNATDDGSSWMSPVTSLFTPNANQSTQPDKNDDVSWMPPIKNDDNDDTVFAPEPPLPKSPDMDMDANAENKSFMSPLTSMFSSDESASSSSLSPPGIEPEPSGDVGGLFDAEPTPKESYYSKVVSGMQWGFDWISILKYIAILVLLALMGLNVFSYLGDASQGAANILGQFSNLFRGIVSDVGKGIKVVVTQTTKTTADGTNAVVDLAASGTKGVVNVTAGAIDSGVNVLDKGLSDKDKNKVKSQTQASLPVPDTDGDITQRAPHKGGKAGYCYIGEDRGFRSCVKVGQMDQCMSGDIFPTKEICINPNLRE